MRMLAAKTSKVWRPSVDDVERISWGKPAKKKGVGSRGVPHRLNNDERLKFDLALQRGFVEIDGSGWRSQRRDSPLSNTYRSYCDAKAQPVIALHKDSEGIDNILVDLSPLRTPEDFASIAQTCAETMDTSGAGFPAATVVAEGALPDLELEEQSGDESAAPDVEAAGEDVDGGHRRKRTRRRELLMLLGN